MDTDHTGLFVTFFVLPYLFFPFHYPTFVAHVHFICEIFGLLDLRIQIPV